jgi:hypothetical protein
MKQILLLCAAAVMLLGAAACFERAAVEIAAVIAGDTVDTTSPADAAAVTDLVGSPTTVRDYD